MTSIVRNFIEQGYADRIQLFDPSICSMATAVSTMNKWNKAGKVTVFMAGTFDIPTPNHRLGLAEARLMAGALVCGVKYSSLNSNTPTRLMNKVRSAAASDLVKLMVTIDTDEGAANSKAFRPEKGNCPKPIFEWATRAHNVASYTAPRNNKTSHPMVDFITNHGPNSCQVCTNCISTDNGLMVTELQPSLVVINAASEATIRTVINERKRGRLPRTVIGITNEHHHQIVDKLLGGRVSGTAVVRRARGEIKQSRTLMKIVEMPNKNETLILDSLPKAYK